LAAASSGSSERGGSVVLGETGKAAKGLSSSAGGEKPSAIGFLCSLRSLALGAVGALGVDTFLEIVAGGIDADAPAVSGLTAPAIFEAAGGCGNGVDPGAGSEGLTDSSFAFAGAARLGDSERMGCVFIDSGSALSPPPNVAVSDEPPAGAALSVPASKVSAAWLVGFKVGGMGGTPRSREAVSLKETAKATPMAANSKGKIKYQGRPRVRYWITTTG
jgi:hypothetical protein